jgi:hypothetical protein
VITKKAKEEKLVVAVVEQRHIYAKTSIADITAEVENDRKAYE